MLNDYPSMTRYRGYICTYGTSSGSSRQPPGQTNIEYTQFFAPSLLSEEKNDLRAHITKMFRDAGVIVSNRAELSGYEKAVDNLSQMTRLSFDVPRDSQTKFFEVVDRIHSQYSRPRQELIVDDIRNVIFVQGLTPLRKNILRKAGITHVVLDF